MSGKLSKILICIMICAGLGIISYPMISELYNRKYQMEAIEEYDGVISDMKEKQIKEERIDAEHYNNALTGADIEDPFIPGSGAVLPDNYKQILDINNGIMGYIEIPDIKVKLPIYHGTSEVVLEKGVGHMEMTAFPIGGAGNHAVLTGHTGLPGNLLFTDLTELGNGDVFYIQILGDTLAYEVNQVLVVRPEDTGALKPAEGEDYVTLVTCTPYAVNTHRLLVRGTRIPYVKEHISDNSDNKWNIPYYFIVPAAVVVLIIVFLYSRKRKKSTGL